MRVKQCTVRSTQVKNSRERSRHQAERREGDGKIRKRAKGRFAAKATTLPPPPLDERAELDSGNKAAIQWISQRSADEVNSYRLKIVETVENLAALYQREGRCEEWFNGADRIVQEVSRGVNGPLLEELVAKTLFEDKAAPNTFRTGAPLVGALAPIDGCPTHEYPEPASHEDLAVSAKQDNRALLETMREDKHGDFLDKQTTEDAENKRMSYPQEMETVDFAAVRMARRFSREQGLKPDGSLKLRAVDDETGNGINTCVKPESKMTTNTADQPVRMTLELQQRTSDELALWKADIDSAFRRIPILPSHRWMAWVVFKNKNKL